MASIRISCPGCGQALRVPEEFQGRQVKCPGCNRMFTAPSEEHLDEATPLQGQVIAEPTAEADDEGAWAEEPEERGRRRRRKAPHRGTLVLVLGIIGLIMPAFGIILGPIAWILGSHDLAEMRAGSMDRSGEGITTAGRVCGMIATGLGFLCIGFYALMFFGTFLPMFFRHGRF